MAQRGELFGEGPQACPFIALELDRDRRSDKPDYRHRCFAEPTPQPRAIAHQEQYCLSPDFARCPIFQGWAMRAAARPVPVPQGYEGRARSGAPGPSLPPEVPQPPAASAPRASTPQPVLPFDVPPIVPPEGESWPADAFAPPEQSGAEQIPAFEAPSVTVPGAMPQFEDAPPVAAGPDPTFDASAAADWSSTSASGTAPANDDDPPVPGFLAGRAERPAAPRPRSSRTDQPEVPYRDTVSREDLVPSWELTDRYGADVTEHRGRSGRVVGDDEGGGGDRFGGLVTMIAVVAILALGVVGVIFLPGMLAGHAPAATPTAPVSALPTGLATPSLPPFASTTPLVTPLPTEAVTPAPTPEATPRLYKIKSTDNSLTAIAHRFGLTLSQLLDANPQITNPDHIQVGQIITIPEPPPTPAPS